MPELPEVETVVRDLEPLVKGRKLSALKVGKKRLRRPWSPQWTRLVVERRIDSIGRRGKWILMHLDDGQCLIIHLGMTGQLTVADAQESAPDHTHWVGVLDEGGRHLRFRDIRRFGSVSRVKDAEAVEDFFQSQKLGPEPFEINRNYWIRALAKTERSLKAVLLDQRIVAGVGNIYADESLYEARLHPATAASRLSSSLAHRLRRAIGVVLHRAIDRRGSSIRNYVGGSGLRGNYQEEFRVYGRPGLPCLCCQTPIKRIRLAGRATHYCPHCQPEPLDLRASRSSRKT